MRRRPLTLLLVLPAVAALGACASTTTGSGTVATGTAGGATTTAASFHTMLSRAARSVTSASVVTRLDAAGQVLAGHGVERLAHGRLTALKTTTTLPNGLGRVSLVYTRGSFYVKLPLARRIGGKPWAKASPTSKEPELYSMYLALHQLLSEASLSRAGQLAAASTAVRERGAVTVQGQHVTRYDITVDVTKLPSTFFGVAALKQAGVSTIPVVVDVDSKGRPVQLSEHFSVLGHTVTSSTMIGRYNAPVKISAPPADQVAH